MFDESLNEATQTSEGDLYVKFWDVNENKVNVRYFGSSFLGHGTHQNLLSHFSDITKDLICIKYQWTALILIAELEMKKRELNS